MAPTFSTSKRHGGVTDLLNSLPDSVLCHILSFLPTKTSVATMSLVSRRWLHLWQHLQAFNFANDWGEGSKQFEKFAFFVNSVLALRKSRDIRKFQLSCDLRTYQDKFRRDCADMWLRAAINPNLQQLSLSFCHYHPTNVLLPHSLFNCNNLVFLSLVGAMKMNVQHFDLHFPSLKYLKLDADIVDSEFVFLLLSACPVLETLQLNDFVPTAWTQVPVPPSSKSLKVTHGSFSWTFLQVEDDNQKTTTLGIIGNLQTMVEACIHFFPSQINESLDPILDNLQVSSSLLDIQLRHSTSKWSLRAQVLNYPEFRNLHHLKFILPCFNTNLIINVLHKCHMIQGLIIQSNKEEQSPLSTWDPKSTTVPNCLKSNLSYIHIEGFQGFEDELIFAEYILQNGNILKTMLIFVDTSMEQTNKYYCLKRLTDIPRRSRMCQLKFDPTVST